MSRLLFRPVVIPVAATGIDPDNLREWAILHGLDDAMNEDTPLAELYDATIEPKRHLDLLPEFGGRFCYRSFEKGRDHEAYLKNIIEMGHGSVLEHVNVTFAVSGVSRSFSHELVRHRAGTAISQESQRYVDASDIKFVVPPLIRRALIEDEAQYESFELLCEGYVDQYKAMQEPLQAQAEAFGITGTMAKKRANEAARAVLPNMAETRMVWTANVRALRHVCELRGSEGADLEIREFACMLTLIMKALAPGLFYDFEVEESEFVGMPNTVVTENRKV